MQEPMTLQEIAKELGMTHQNVMYILNGAIKKIKKKLAAKRIYEYTDIAIGEVSNLPESHDIYKDKDK